LNGNRTHDLCDTGAYEFHILMFKISEDVNKDHGGEKLSK